MISLEIFILGLLITSTITGLTTEAIKKVLTDYKIAYKANTLVGIIAMVISLAIGLSYILLMNIAFTSQIIVYLVALIFMSWLCAMVGYDKVIQTISQFKISQSGGKNNE